MKGSGALTESICPGTIATAQGRDEGDFDGPGRFEDSLAARSIGLLEEDGVLSLMESINVVNAHPDRFMRPVPPKCFGGGGRLADVDILVTHLQRALSIVDISDFVKGA